MAPTQDLSPLTASAADDSEPRTSRGIQSVEVGGQLLKALAHTGRRMALKDLARAAGMTPAKAHPYLVSFGKLGLIEQDADSGHYGLGALAIQMGMISLQQLDPIRLAIAELPALALDIGATVALSVWGTHGPTIIRVEEGPADIHVAMRHGTNASVRNTASGKLFAAFMPCALVQAALAADGHPHALEEPGFLQALETTRREHFSAVAGELVAGISAMSVPVFDSFGHLVLSLSVIGPSSTLDISAHAAPARQLRQCAQRLTQRLGGTVASAAAN